MTSLGRRLTWSYACIFLKASGTGIDARGLSRKIRRRRSLSMHLQSLEVYTCEPLLSRVPASLPTNEPQHVPVHQVYIKPALNKSVAASQSRRVKISPFQTGTPLICRRPYCDSVEPMTSMSLCHELCYHVRHEYAYCDSCVNRSDDNMLDGNIQVSQRLTNDPKTTPQQCNKGDRQPC